MHPAPTIGLENSLPMRFVRLAAASAVVSMFAACGGGGDSAPSAPSTGAGTDTGTGTVPGVGVGAEDAGGTVTPPASPSTCTTGKTIYIAKGADNGFFADGANHAAKPGDTLVLKASLGQWSYFALKHFNGTAECPIIVKNEGGQVQMTDGIAIENSTYIRVTGTGSGDTYGFRIDSGDRKGAGVSIFGRSNNVEVDHVEVLNKLYGFWIKEEASCNPALQYPNWVLDNMKIHHNRIANMGQSGMYLGSTDPNGGRSITCGGVVTQPWPLRLGNFQIHNNFVEDTNRTGIQLSGAEFGANAIYNNTIRRTGYELNDQQGSGIAIGGYTHADVLNNLIENTFNAGILVLGAGPVNVKGNSIANSGSLPAKPAAGIPASTTGGMAGIMVDVRPTTPFTRLQLTIRNNTIGANTDAGVRVWRSFDGYAATNVICQNTGTQSIESNVAWTAQCN